MQIYPIKQTCSRTSINHIRRKVKLLWIVVDLTEIAHCYAMTCTLDVIDRRLVKVVYLVILVGLLEEVVVDVYHLDE